jgi:hypothetical protein
MPKLQEIENRHIPAPGMFLGHGVSPLVYRGITDVSQLTALVLDATPEFGKSSLVGLTIILAKEVARLQAKLDMIREGLS